jgi:hypothetical protein
VAAHIPVKIQTGDTNVTTEAAQMSVQVSGDAILNCDQNAVTSEVPILYNQVAVTAPSQLATKSYVDETLANFINVSGAAKQYLQATSNTPITTSGRVTNWNVSI